MLPGDIRDVVHQSFGGLHRQGIRDLVRNFVSNHASLANTGPSPMDVGALGDG